MIRTLLFLIAFWAYQVAISPLLLYALFLEKRGEAHRARRIAEYICVQWSRLNMAMAGARIRVTGRIDVPPEQPVLVASNHMGAFDIPILGGYLGRPIIFVSKVELARIPLVGQWIRILGCIFLDRADHRQGRMVIDRSVQALREGANLVIFPEATRSDGPFVRRFKTGAARIAIRAQVPIIPVAMKETYLLKRKSTWKITPAEVEMIICPAVPTEGLGQGDAAALTDRLRAAILARLPAGHDRSDLHAFTPEATPPSS